MMKIYRDTADNNDDFIQIETAIHEDWEFWINIISYLNIFSIFLFFLCFSNDTSILRNL